MSGVVFGDLGAVAALSLLKDSSGKGVSVSRSTSLHGMFFLPGCQVMIAFVN